MAASNTKECFRECVGKRVVGVLFDAMPPNRRDLSDGTKTLLFDDGTGLTIASHGSFWIEQPEEVKRALAQVHSDLRRNQRDIKDVLDAAGALLPDVNENRPDLPVPWKPDTGLRAADTRSYSEIETSIAERSKKFKNDFGSQSEHQRYMALALAGEVGEMCNLIKKEWREGQLDGKALLDEYSDIFVYWLLGCHTHGWTLRCVVEHADAKAERKLKQVLAERSERT